jgi:acyl CoA:acetate/3-ketoacid CoA transferase
MLSESSKSESVEVAVDVDVDVDVDDPRQSDPRISDQLSSLSDVLFARPELIEESMEELV